MITILFVLVSTLMIKNFDFINHCTNINTCDLCSSISNSISSDEKFKIKFGIYRNETMLFLQLNISDVLASRVVYKTKFRFHDHVFELNTNTAFLDDSTVVLQLIATMKYPYNGTNDVHYY